jgi:hypothetical protein
MIYMWFTGINCYKLAVENEIVTVFARLPVKHIMSSIRMCLYCLFLVVMKSLEQVVITLLQS